MSLFGDLFEDGSSQFSNNTSLLCDGDKIDIPKPPRLSNGLCGIYNQGATCYLNSLLQTLFMTPEFREALFQLDSTELGHLEDRDTPNSKVRVIPIHLQRLFGALLLINQQGASTQDLTDSFGWTNNEELQQHDVQELNRILFSAIEDSLIGTSGQQLINRLYHGAIVNQIICQECNQISEREEDFLDLCLAVAGCDDLPDSLCQSYVVKEMMEGGNQYRCDNCNKLVNATKGAKIRHLPPILTISLLRFSFDFTKRERYKEIGKFVFPTEIDMGEFCENLSNAGNTEYELFSVVIHRGSGYGGHYHAYIRDVDGLGKWTHPDEEEIVLPMDPNTGKVDYIEFDSPIELLQALLLQQPAPHSLPVDKLCAELVKQTGVSWNKRFKKSHGPINKFVKKYDDKFVFDGQNVGLRDYNTSKANLETLPDRKYIEKETTDSVKEEQKGSNKRPRSPLPDPGNCWFDFDDSRVHPIRKRELEKQFSGKESAYMLFYRQKGLSRPKEAAGDASYNVPDYLLAEMMRENEALQIKREEYENKINSISVDVHFGGSYVYRDGALQPVPDALPFIELTLDKRKTIAEFKEEIREVGGSLVAGDFTLHLARERPAGLHLYDCVSLVDTLPVRDTAVDHRSKVFVWDGSHVAGTHVPTGHHCEPIHLTITYGNPSKVSSGFPRNMLLGELRLFVSNHIGLPENNLLLSRIISKGTDTAVINMNPDQDGLTLGDLKLEDGDNLIAENLNQTGIRLTETEIAKQSRLISFIVQNRCLDMMDGDWPLVAVEVDRDILVGELKAEILARLQLYEVQEGGRLRVDHDSSGIGPPMHDDQTLDEAGLGQEQRIVIEPGPAPHSQQMTLSFTTCDSEIDVLEMMADSKMTVQECLLSMLHIAKLKGDDWHLRKTNFFGEATQVLDDASLTLEQCQLRDGDHMLLETGKLPPKGYIKMAVFLQMDPHLIEALSDQPGIISWLSSSIQGMLGSGDKPKQERSSPLKHMSVGDLVISKEATLEELKLQITTLPKFSELCAVPSPAFLRLSILENKRCTTVLRGKTQILQRLKLVSGCELVARVLQEEEDLTANQVVLSIQHRVVETRAYFPAEEFIWDTSKGQTPQLLRQAIAHSITSSVDAIVIAKHFPEKYEWLVIKNDHSNQKNKNNKNKKKKVNVRHSPYFIKDGDTIGIKDRALDWQDRDDFSTVGDDAGKQALIKEAEDKKKKREKNRLNNASSVGPGDGEASSFRREVGIKIHVGDFR